MQTCSVCECDPGEVPQSWVAAEERSCAAETVLGPGNAVQGGACSSVKCSAEEDAKVDRGLEPGMESKLLNLKRWRGYNNPWMAEGEREEEFLYINLLTNPERYTGYQGEHAHRIWSAIYNQQCFSETSCGGIAEVLSLIIVHILHFDE